MASEIFETGGVRVAIEGCGHGTLHAIYASIDTSCKTRGWDGVDLLIIGGDFQATRNAADLTVMSVPVKYREMGDFHEYYSGKRKAPYLTVFVGGNHEAASYLWELFYGGWVAPNIYYCGAANVLRLGPLRIAGLSGIWKGFDYRKPHHERLPFSPEDVKSFYHVREIDVRKLLQLREPVDVGISHDWPRAIEKHGDSAWLFRKKPMFRDESRDGTLGSVAAEYLMNRLRPPYWFSAHLHIKYSAIKQYEDPKAAENGSEEKPKEEEPTPQQQPSRKAIDLPPPSSEAPDGPAKADNPDEIDLDMDDDNDSSATKPVTAENASESAAPEANGTLAEGDKSAPELGTSNSHGVSSELLAQLPASFMRPHTQQSVPRNIPGQPVPSTITNKVVRFLALDKCLPGRHYLQLCEIPALAEEAAAHPPNNDGTDLPGRFRLEYDPEWLAITRVFAKELNIGDPNAHTPADQGEEHYRGLIDTERKWVEENIVAKGQLLVPDNFSVTAPVHTLIPGQPETYAASQPIEYTNPQTETFCNLVGVPNFWNTSEEERAERRLKGPPPSTGGGNYRGGGRGGYGGRGGHRGGGFNGRGRGRGRGRGGRW